MSILEEVLKEEITRLENHISSYEDMLSKLPRGTIFVRKMNKASFVYRKRKEDGKVISEYLGNINTELAQKEIERSKEYSRIKSNLLVAKSELKKLKKAIQAYE